MNSNDFLSGIRKRFSSEFTRSRFSSGGISKRELAKKIGMTASQVTRMEYKDNPSTPTHLQIYLLCKNYGADLHYIYFGERHKKIIGSIEQRISALEKMVKTSSAK